MEPVCARCPVTGRIPEQIKSAVSSVKKCANIREEQLDQGALRSFFVFFYFCSKETSDLNKQPITSV